MIRYSVRITTGAQWVDLGTSVKPDTQRVRDPSFSTWMEKRKLTNVLCMSIMFIILFLTLTCYYWSSCIAGRLPFYRSFCSLLSQSRTIQLCAAWFHCLYRLSTQAISLCSAFMGNLGLLGVQSFGEIYHRNTGRQFNNAAVDSWEKPSIYLM